VALFFLMSNTDRDEQLFEPANAFEAQAAAAFDEAATGIGRLDVLVLGALDGGLTARIAGRDGAGVALVDNDAGRVKRAKTASGEDLRVSYSKAWLGDLRERADPGSFDMALSHLALAREENFEEAIAAIYPLLRTDCLFAFTLPNPYLDAPLEEDPLAPSRERPKGIEDWLDGPVFHRPIGELYLALRDAGFTLAAVRDFPGEPGRPETACLLFECGREKW
jgi:SAM-dependent methyltransferase